MVQMRALTSQTYRRASSLRLILLTKILALS